MLRWPSRAQSGAQHRRPGRRAKRERQERALERFETAVKGFPNVHGRLPNPNIQKNASFNASRLYLKLNA